MSLLLLSTPSLGPLLLLLTSSSPPLPPPPFLHTSLPLCQWSWDLRTWLGANTAKETKCYHFTTFCQAWVGIYTMCVCGERGVVLLRMINILPSSRIYIKTLEVLHCLPGFGLTEYDRGRMSHTTRCKTESLRLVLLPQGDRYVMARHGRQRYRSRGRAVSH